MLINLLEQETPVTALPIHDSFIVPFGKEYLLNEAMKKAFIDLVGVEPKIDRDEVVFNEEENKERIIVAGKLLHERVSEQIKTHTQYNRTCIEWVKRNGPF